MIVVDTNVVAHLAIPGGKGAAARRLLSDNPAWAAPRLLHDEFLNILAKYIHSGLLKMEEGLGFLEMAEEVMAERLYVLPSEKVLRVSAASGLSAYDSQFVALAMDLEVPLVTEDKKILEAYPALARSLPDIVEPG